MTFIQQRESGGGGLGVDRLHTYYECGPDGGADRLTASVRKLTSLKMERAD